MATQAFSNSLNVVAGYFGRGMLQKVLKAKSTSIPNAVAGRAGYIDATTGEWVHGPCATKKGPAYFVFRGVNQPDVYSDGAYGSNFYEKYWVSGNAQGNITCIPATGGFELQTTEFVTTSTYTNGDMLKVGSDGKLDITTSALGGDPIVGFCAPFTQYPENMWPAAPANLSPVGINSHGISVLNFMTAFYPKTT